MERDDQWYDQYWVVVSLSQTLFIDEDSRSSRFGRMCVIDGQLLIEENIDDFDLDDDGPDDKANDGPTTMPVA